LALVAFEVLAGCCCGTVAKRRPIFQPGKRGSDLLWHLGKIDRRYESARPTALGMRFQEVRIHHVPHSTTNSPQRAGTITAQSANWDLAKRLANKISPLEDVRRG
jgi:hypothetical protein